MAPLMIQTTGLAEYAPGGTARVKILNVGGPGVGKTRWASYFPRPIFADCERGLASIADRNVPYVSIDTSQDMLDLLAMLKQECSLPAERRRFDTVVIDTLDAFQRKVKDEWLQQKRAESFSGWDAWGYLNNRIQMLMVRLLNLDMHVVVNVHFKTKSAKEGETETSQLMLQLQGEVADSAFNDFDLVGWTGVYWEAEGGKRVQKRGITFTPTPDKPFLKDRLYVTPPWLNINFDTADFDVLQSLVQSKIEKLGQSSVIGQVPSQTTTTSAVVVAPGDLGSGPLPHKSAPSAPAPEAKPSLAQMDKPTLQKIAKDRGITTTADGKPIKGNTSKGELVAAIEAAQTPQPPVANAERTQVGESPQEALKTPEPDVQQAVDTVNTVLGGETISGPTRPTPTPEPTQQAPTAPPVPERKDTCDVCGTSIVGENSTDGVKLAWIKFRRNLCEDDYQKAKAAR